MSPSRSLSYGLVVLASFLTHIFALSAEYCSSLNTGQTTANSSIYQSNGLCYNFCLDDYAFAILQADDCWCSNDAPGVTTSTSDCNLACSGYPDDLCGSSDGLFGYFSLTKSPTATVDGSSAAASSTSADQSTSETTSITKSSSSSIQTITSSSSTSTWTPTPVTSLETVTGQVRTVTVTPTIPPESQSSTAVTKKSGGGLGTGGAVGLTVGLVALVALVCAIIYFCIRRRQKERKREAEAFTEGSRGGSSAGLGGPIPSRTMSENSRYILGTDGRQVVETWEPESRDTPGSRKSRLMPVDPRLDPFAPVYQRGENKSRESVNTIRDDHDYSRRFHQQGPILRATNPDE